VSDGAGRTSARRRAMVVEGTVIGEELKRRKVEGLKVGGRRSIEEECGRDSHTS